MNGIKAVYDWALTIIYSASDFISYLTTPIVEFEGHQFTPLGLISIGGLSAYIIIATIKWLTI